MLRSMKYQLDLEFFRRDIGEDRDERGAFDLLGAGDLIVALPRRSPARGKPMRRTVSAKSPLMALRVFLRSASHGVA